VARYTDGRLVKGTTQDFAPAKDTFHVTPPEPGAKPVLVSLADLKAVFFVKDLAGNPDHHDSYTFSQPVPGRKLRVTFRDGEVIMGTTQAYQPDRAGFFLVPADPSSNNDRIFIVTRAVAGVAYL
jgi:hypothetical protein